NGCLGIAGPYWPTADFSNQLRGSRAVTCISLAAGHRLASAGIFSHLAEFQHVQHHHRRAARNLTEQTRHLLAPCASLLIGSRAGGAKHQPKDQQRTAPQIASQLESPAK